MIFLDHRPIFLAEGLNTKLCTLDYGKPSGHVTSMLIVVPVFFYSLQKKMNVKNFVKISAQSLFVIFLIGFSRLYFAKHSLNQLILGFVVGIFILILNTVCLGPVIFEHILKPVINGPIFLYRKSQDTIEEEKKKRKNKPASIETGVIENALYSVETTSNLKFAFYLLVIIFTAKNMLLVGGKYYAKQKVEFPTSDFFKSFKNCFHALDSISFSFSNKIIRDVVVFNFLFGLIIAQAFHYKKILFSSVGDTVSTENSPFNIFQSLRINYDGNLRRIVFRFLVFLFFFVPTFAPFLFGKFLKSERGRAFHLPVSLASGLVSGLLCGLFYGKICWFFGVSVHQLKFEVKEEIYQKKREGKVKNE